MPNSDKILNNVTPLGQIVILKVQKLLVDLIVFEMPDFDMILGIDFLSRYEAKID